LKGFSVVKYFKKVVALEMADLDMQTVDRLRAYLLAVCHSLFELSHTTTITSTFSDESESFLLGFARSELQLYADLIHDDETGHHISFEIFFILTT
jgi:hypothetical protein